MLSFSPLFTLQKYRHVDNIMFENHTVADRFLDFWRKTGNQHFGYLYGRYTEHKDIPLGIRAEVAAIYEPPQVGLWSWVSAGPSLLRGCLHRLCPSASAFAQPACLFICLYAHASTRFVFRIVGE